MVGPVSPMLSTAAMPASTVGDSAVADPWKTSTRTFAPPGGDGRDNVVDALMDCGSGYGLAEAGSPPSSEAVRAPAPSAATKKPVLDLDR